MPVRITIPIDAASLQRAHAEAAARGVTVEAYVTQLVRTWLPPEPAAEDDASSIFGLVQDGEPTDIARNKEAVWQKDTKHK